MKESHIIQYPNDQSSAPTFLKTVDHYCKTYNLDLAFISMAYVTVSGVRSILECFPNGKPASSRWVIGLDDCVTQPGAIDHVLSLPNSKVRIASLNEHNLRFHPKVMYLKSSRNAGNALMLIGSANLTFNALTKNAEAGVFLESQSTSDTSSLDGLWSSHWRFGRVPDEETLKIYRNKYQTAKAARHVFQSGIKATIKKPRVPKRYLVLQTDDAEVDPSQANHCWIECGYITAMGRELEFKAEQGLFFGIEPTGGQTRRVRFIVSDGNVVELKIKYQGNHMWRLQMTNEVPEVRLGLRPRDAQGGLGRSEQVAVITRTSDPGVFTLRFLKLSTPEFAKLKEETIKNGTMGNTSARSYGWF